MFGNSIVKRVLIACICVSFVGSAVFGAKGDGKKIGVLWTKKSGMAERVLEGAKTRLNKIAPGIEIEVVKDLPNDDEAKVVFDKWQSEKDGIVFLRSDGGKFLAANPSKVPAFIGACNNPEKLGLMKDMKKPGGNVTGVTYYLPAEFKMNLFKKVLPDMKSVALLVELGHPSSPIEQSEVKAYCEKKGITYKDAVCKDKADLKAKVDSLKASVDVFILGNQKLLIDNSDIVLQTSPDKPIVSLTEKPVEKKLALIGMAADDTKLGEKLGDCIVAVIVDGKPVSEVPVQLDEQPKVIVCVELMKKWGVKLPMDIVKIAKLIK